MEDPGRHKGGPHSPRNGPIVVVVVRLSCFVVSRWGGGSMSSGHVELISIITCKTRSYAHAILG